MTESLVQKVEEKVAILLDQLDRLRKEVSQLKQENTLLKSERNNHTKKLQGLVSLLDIVDVSDNHMTVTGGLEIVPSREAMY
jgi:regulator of replication initiation timing